METKHTPGQMRYDLVTEGPFSGLYSVHPFDPLNPVAFCHTEDQARLIAAAPELLKRLDELCETVIALEKKTTLSALDVERFQNARAAIAKATGSAA